MSHHHTVTFICSGRGKAQCAPDPDYPHGKAIDFCEGRTHCNVTLQYPAPECGHFLIQCNLCKVSIAITAAGRPDDPTSITLPCDLTRIPASKLVS